MEENDMAQQFGWVADDFETYDDPDAIAWVAQEALRQLENPSPQHDQK